MYGRGKLPWHRIIVTESSVECLRRGGFPEQGEFSSERSRGHACTCMPDLWDYLVLLRGDT